MGIKGRIVRAAHALLGPEPGYNPQTDSFKTIGGGARTTRSTDLSVFEGFSRRIPRPSSGAGYESYEKLSTQLVLDLPGEETRRMFVTNNPSVSRVVNDAKKFGNPGWTLEPEGHPLFDVLFDNMKAKNRKFNTVINSFISSLIVDGAMFSELVIGNDGMPKNIKDLPAYTAVFKKEEDEDGEFEMLCQEVLDMEGDYEDGLKPLGGDPTISYDPLFPDADNPYGRTIIDPALYHLMMVKGFFQSYKHAVASIIWPNLLINIDRETLKDMPIEDQNKVVRDLVEQVSEEVKKLGPGGLLVFGSEVQVGDYISGMNKTNLGAVMDCVDIMDREVIRGLETEPVLFGRNEGLAETHVENQMINYGYFINNCQQIVNEVLTGYFNIILRVNGSNEAAQFRLHFSISEEYIRRAQVYKIEKEALEAGSKDLMTLVQAIEAAKQAGLMDETQAKEYFDAQMLLREREDLFRLPR